MLYLAFAAFVCVIDVFPGSYKERRWLRMHSAGSKRKGSDVPRDTKTTTLCFLEIQLASYRESALLNVSLPLPLVWLWLT